MKFDMMKTIAHGMRIARIVHHHHRNQPFVRAISSRKKNRNENLTLYSVVARSTVAAFCVF